MGFHTDNLMKARTILLVVERASNFGWRMIIYDSNSQVMVNLLNKKNFDGVSWHLALIAKQILNLYASLECITFTHIPREWNGVSDCLAKWASDHIHDWNLVDRGQLP